MTDPDIRQKFYDDGYYVIRGLLSPEEAPDYRIEINRLLGLPGRDLSNEELGKKTYALADGVTKMPSFWALIFNQRLIATVRTLLGPDIQYTQHSDMHINLGTGKFHRDSANRDFGTGHDWGEQVHPYRIIWIALYLSDYRESSSSVIVLPDPYGGAATTLDYNF